MQTKIIEAVQPGAPQNWGKFLVMKPDTEWKRSAATPGCELAGVSPATLTMLGWSPEEIAARSLLAQIGWGTSNVIVFDLQTGEGARFAPGGDASYDLNKHAIWVCPLYEPFLVWLYGQDLEDLEALPDSVEVEADFEMSGYRRPGIGDSVVKQAEEWLREARRADGIVGYERNLFAEQHVEGLLAKLEEQRLVLAEAETLRTSWPGTDEVSSLPEIADTLPVPPGTRVGVVVVQTPLGE